VHQLRTLATALAAVATLAGCSAAARHGSAPAPSASDSSQPPPLHSEVDSQYTYTLEDLHSCQVGDALAIAINQAAEPLRVTATALTITGGSAHRTDQGTYQVAAVQPGFVGEIAASFRLAVLAGYHLKAAPGALLSPVSAAGQGYVFVVWLHVHGAHPRPWTITGLTVRYQLREQSYTAFFPQQIKLPPVNCSQ
jgi:hypothetical protein